MSKKESLAQARNKCLKAFQLLRRLEEADDNGYCTCISTGKRQYYKDMDGGHYLSRRYRPTEIEHDNVWPQSKYANQYLAGDPLNYRDNLIKKIGLDRVERLENLVRAYQGADVEVAGEDRWLLQKRTKLFYSQKYKEFAQKINELKAEKGL